MTKKIELYYSIDQENIYPPNASMLEMKEEWIRNIQKSVKSNHEPKTIKLTYEEVNEEVRKLQKFFMTCVKWYAIQNDDVFEGDVDYKRVHAYREEILDELLGYDVTLVTKIQRKRKSTTKFKDAQAWNNFLKTFKETLFESAGYQFPDSKEFWELAEDRSIGYAGADRILRERLQTLIKKRLNG